MRKRKAQRGDEKPISKEAFLIEKLDKLRPESHPFLPAYMAREHGGDLSSYADRIIARLRSSPALTKRERDYVFCLAEIFDCTNSLHGPALRAAANNCKVAGEPKHTWFDFDARLEALLESLPTEGAAHLPWKVLPPGKALFAQVYAHYRKLKRSTTGRDWDLDRLRFAQSLKPHEIWVGTDDFEGYTIFIFNWTRAALLDHPLTGNAVYVLRRKWRELSRATKADLMESQDKFVRRVVHSGNWKKRIKRILDGDRPSRPKQKNRIKLSRQIRITKGRSSGRE